MKNSPDLLRLRRLVRLWLLLAALLGGVPMAWAGLTIDIHLYFNQAYFAYGWLHTNGDSAAFPAGTYSVSAPQVPDRRDATPVPVRWREPDLSQRRRLRGERLSLLDAIHHQWLLDHPGDQCDEHQHLLLHRERARVARRPAVHPGHYFPHCREPRMWLINRTLPGRGQRDGKERSK